MINIAGYQFEGPYTKTDSFKDNAGIYAILTRGQATAQWTVLDIGESDQVKSRIGNHDRKDCWNRNNQGTLAGAVLYTPDWTATQRRNLESSLREQYTPTCGVI
jgi:hypothetical protein